MPRSSRYLVEGYVYHLTQRCHDRRFLLRFARDRDAYREWWRKGVRRFRVPVYGYCITRNHVHAVVFASDTEAVSRLMQLASGATAAAYNKRKGREGSMWEHPFHATIVETGRHLLNCLCYVDLNMVRAGRVRHPSDWRWCGYHELVGQRQRYRLLDTAHLLDRVEMERPADFQTWYRDAIEERLCERRLAREACWTESLAVGSRPFVEGIRAAYPARRLFDLTEVSSAAKATWSIREQPIPYAVKLVSKTAPETPEDPFLGANLLHGNM